MTNNRSAGTGATRPVYSTDTGRLCPECGRPVAECVCRANKARAAMPPSDGIVRVSLETKGRKGKGVTLITGLSADPEALALAAKALKAACGSGGTVKDGTIEIQGDHRALVIATLTKQGKTVKRAGG